MPRLMLTDEHWSKLRTIMREHGIYDKPNLRKTVEGILYRMRTQCEPPHCSRQAKMKVASCVVALSSKRNSQPDKTEWQ